MKKIVNIRSNINKYICIVALFFNGIVNSVLLNINYYYYDSRYYNSIGDAVFSNGFNLMLYPETYRGCMLPLIISFIKKFLGEIWGWRILSSFMVALMLGLFLPYIMNYTIETIKDIIPIIVAQLVLLFFWGNFLQYPLSDMPATFFLIATVYLVKILIKIVNDNNNRQQILKYLFISVLTSVCIYLAYNCRVAYIYGGIISLLTCIFFIVKQKKYKYLLYGVISLIFGIAIISYPQCKINKQYVGEYTPRICTEQYTDYNASLQSTQLLWGLSYLRFEGYVGDESLYSDAGVSFNDLVGNKIIELESINADNFKMTDILKIIIKYPLDAIGIYTKHFISLATPLWNQIYITNLFTNKTILVFISIILWMILGIKIASRIEMKEYRIKDTVLIVSICIPALMQLFGAPEMRFFFPFHIILYSFVFMERNIKQYIIYIKRKWTIIIPIIIFVSFLWITIIGDILASNNECVMLISR